MSYEFDGLVEDLRPYAEALLEALRQAGFTAQVTSVYRGFAAQKKLFDAYTKGHSRYPAAPPGFSAHNQGWAFDISVNDESVLPDAGALWESWGGTWGGHFSDPIHFEMGGASAYLGALRQSGAAPPPDPFDTKTSYMDTFTHWLGEPYRVYQAAKSDLGF